MTLASSRWRILQIADSGFPVGGFAHSAGLEAAAAKGQAATPEALDAWLEAYIWNVGHASLPFVGASYDRPAEPAEAASLCEWNDATLTNHVANRASRTQGRAFLATSTEVFTEPAIAALATHIRGRDCTAHLAPIFGAVLRALGIPRSDALAMHLHLALRGITSAAVRLGMIGPLEAQRLHVRFGPTLDVVLEACAALRPDQATSVAPLQDIFGATHDTLYARLFQS
jgi:urease accessory protein